MQINDLLKSGDDDLLAGGDLRDELENELKRTLVSGLLADDQLLT